MAQAILCSFQFHLVQLEPRSFILLALPLYLGYLPRVARGKHAGYYMIVDELKDKLTDRQLQMFKETCFGHFLDLPKVHIQRQLFHHLMMKENISNEPDKFITMVNGARLCFGLQEFAIMTGLNCYGEVLDVVTDSPNRLICTYFKGCNNVPKSELVSLFHKKGWNGDDDAVKIAVLYCIQTFVLSTSNLKTFVPKEHFDLVESEAYQHYPWGRASFNELIKTVQHKFKPLGQFYRIGGLPLALQAWFYECCSLVDKSLAIRVDSSVRVPRMLTWKVIDKKPRFDNLAKGIFRSTGNTVVFSNISPTADEKHILNMPDLVDAGCSKDAPTGPTFNATDNIQMAGDDVVPTRDQVGKIHHHAAKDTPVQNEQYTHELQPMKNEIAILKRTVDDQFKVLMDFVTKSFDKVFAQLKLLSESKGVGGGLSEEGHVEIKESCDKVNVSEYHVDTGIGLGPAKEDQGVRKATANINDMTNTRGKAAASISPHPVSFDAPSFDLGVFSQHGDDCCHNSTHESAECFATGSKSPPVVFPVREMSGGETSKGKMSGCQTHVVDDLDFPYLTDSQYFQLDSVVKDVVSWGQRRLPENTDLGDVGAVVENSCVDDDQPEEENAVAVDTASDEHNSPIVLVESDHKACVTPEQFISRLRRPGKYDRSPWVKPPKPIFQMKHPFMDGIGVGLDADLVNEFVAWVEDGLEIKPSRQSAYPRVINNLASAFELGVEREEKKHWFYLLLHKALNDTHIDVIFYYLRKKGKYGPNNQCSFTTTDCCFKTRVVEVYNAYRESNNDSRVISDEDVLAEYILGYRLLANTPWVHVDYVLMPINVVDLFHWVLGVVSFKDRSIFIYDSLNGEARHDAAVLSVVEAFATVSLIYLSVTSFYGERPDIDWKTNDAFRDKSVTDPYNVVMIDNLPKQNEESNDCGVFTAAYAEYFCNGLHAPPEDFDADIHRRRLGALLWEYGRRKQSDGAVSASEVTGKLYKKKGGRSLKERFIRDK